jgi:glycosyltransferase involved in cell wall biosynthesis
LKAAVCRIGSEIPDIQIRDAESAMRILFLGRAPDGAVDEGMKNVLTHYCRGLSPRHEVRVVDLENLRGLRLHEVLRNFLPDIIHYLAGPTLTGVILLRRLKALSSAKSVLTIIHPWFPLRTDRLLGFFLPDLVLAPSRRSARLFEQHGARVEFFPFGVDTMRFVPAGTEQRSKWRRAFGLPSDRYLLLHVGHIIHRRGIEALARVQSGDQQVLIVGSVNTPADARIKRRLEERGILVWTKYIPEIEKIHALADCYVFPTRDPLGAIELPLSVLESMSCDVPVLAFPFGGLPDLFPADDGLVYEDRLERWPERISELRTHQHINNRGKVIVLDWKNVIDRLEQHYLRLAGDGRN